MNTKVKIILFGMSYFYTYNDATFFMLSLFTNFIESFFCLLKNEKKKWTHLVFYPCYTLSYLDIFFGYLCTTLLKNITAYLYYIGKRITLYY